MTNISVLPVQNGTTVLSPATLNYVERYKSFARRTAESIIGLALTLIEAEECLGSVDFESFCNEVGVPKGGSTYKKLRAIGANATRFEPFVDNLPNTWTTIYKLAKLEPEEFDRVTSILSPFVTAKAIDEAVGTLGGKAAPKASKTPEIGIRLDLLELEEKGELYGRLIELKNTFGFVLEVSEELEEQILSLHKQALAA